MGGLSRRSVKIKEIRDRGIDPIILDAGDLIFSTKKIDARNKNAELTRADAMLEGSRRAMKVALMRETDRIEQHLPFLASVGSTSPYIGLFGTVWGIMHSFRGLANATQATLATVAPGISEALIATAMGLFAAIPAVLAYNKLAARSDVLLNRYETFVDEFSGILQRQAYALRAQQGQRR